MAIQSLQFCEHLAKPMADYLAILSSDFGCAQLADEGTFFTENYEGTDKLAKIKSTIGKVAKHEDSEQAGGGRRARGCR